MSDITFRQLNLPNEILTSLDQLGYEMPTPIQEKSIPVFLEDHDLLAQAQTGTGKTAAFALPILSKIDVSIKKPQALIVAPTRELAIQVAEAFQSYAQFMKGFFVAAMYGGQDYNVQLRALKRGIQVVVGTPGRLIDHIKRGTLEVDHLNTVILDEADEMLRMGFIDDVEWIFKQIPHEHQTGLFSATLPQAIKKIAKNYLNNPTEIHIKPTERTTDLIEQSFIRVNRHQKMDLLTSVLEVEDMQAGIIFTRTKTASSEIAEKLQARGYAAQALNGDMNQSHREKVIERLKDGSLDLIVATDVAARGIDVDRITHVFNFDIPYDAEPYVHRIGRTGRAGRKGKAILFVTPREFHLLKDIEYAIKKRITRIDPPSAKEINQSRAKRIVEKLLPLLSDKEALNQYRSIVNQIKESADAPFEDIASALLYDLHGPESQVTEFEQDERPKRNKRRDNNKRFSKDGKRSFNRDSDRKRSGNRSDGRKFKSERSERRSFKSKK